MMTVLRKNLKKTKQKLKNDISNKVVSGNDKTTTPKKNNNNISNIVTRDCSLCDIQFDTSFDVNKDSKNPMEVLCSSRYYQLFKKNNVIEKKELPMKY